MRSISSPKIARDRRRIAEGIQSIKNAGFWCIDIPRTSSSNIKLDLRVGFGAAFGKSNLLDKSLGQSSIFEDHIPARLMIRLLGAECWRSLFTFNVVRNPWDRQVSCYHYRKVVGNIPSDMSFTGYIRLIHDHARSLEYARYHGHIYSAADFLTNDAGEIDVSTVIKYEERELGLCCEAEKIGIKKPGLLAG